MQFKYDRMCKLPHLIETPLRDLSLPDDGDNAGNAE